MNNSSLISPTFAEGTFKKEDGNIVETNNLNGESKIQISNPLNQSSESFQSIGANNVKFSRLGSNNKPK